VLEEFLREIKNSLDKNLKKIVLFGSRARGEGKAGSDYDLLLVLEKIDRRTRDLIDSIVSWFLVEKGVYFSVHSFTQEQLEKMRFEPFIINAEREGILL